MLLAVGTATTTTAGKLPIIVKLNSKGNAALEHGGKPKLTAKGTFTLAPAGHNGAPPGRSRRRSGATSYGEITTPKMQSLPG